MWQTMEGKILLLLWIIKISKLPIHQMTTPSTVQCLFLNLHQGMSIQYYWYFQYFQNGIGYWYFQYFWHFCQIKVLVLNTFILLWPIPNTFHIRIFHVFCVFLRFTKGKLVFAFNYGNLTDENFEKQLLLQLN